jgi:hypothetical protein
LNISGVVSPPALSPGSDNGSGHVGSPGSAYVLADIERGREAHIFQKALLHSLSQMNSRIDHPFLTDLFYFEDNSFYFPSFGVGQITVSSQPQSRVKQIKIIKNSKGNLAHNL